MDTLAAPPAMRIKSSTQLFGSFHLGDLELALSIHALQEVVAFPSDITPVPSAPPYLLGLFNLRGTLLPIVHLGRFLGLTDDTSSQARLAVIVAGDVQLGVLFDQTGEMLSLPTNRLVSFAHATDSLGLIESAFHLDNRILQVLSADALSRLPGLPQLRNPDIAQQVRDAHRAQGRRHKAISFRTSDRLLALPIDAIHEIIRFPALEHSVLANAVCKGWLTLRGRPVPVVDFAAYLGLTGSSADTFAESVDDPRRVLVLRQEDAYLGLLVDEVVSIEGYLAAQLLPIPAIRGHGGIFAGCISRADIESPGLVLVDVPALLAEPAMSELAKGHHDLYLVAEGEQGSVKTLQQEGRETWVTFHLDRWMGLPIEQLREVIDYDSSVVPPPGAPPYVRGVLNLRQTLITLIDLRRLYQMSEADDLATSKVLVVEHNGHKYGLVVDALRDIISIDRANKLAIPGLVAAQLNPELRDDLCHVVEVDEHHTLMLLDSRPLMRRLTGTGTDTPLSRIAGFA